MNVDYYLRRLSGRATCRLASGARLMRTARIRNIRGDNDCIVIGANSVIRGELLTFAHGGKIEIGSWCYIGESTRIWSGSLIQIGNRVLIAHGVNVFDSLTHP
jgi:acetyltransferase-like isoleucine patch superfamily enzyme